jgi:hypothetical protein
MIEIALRAETDWDFPIPWYPSIPWSNRIPTSSLA